MNRLLATLALVITLAIPANTSLQAAATGIVGDASLGTSLVSCWEMDETSGTREDAQATNDLTDNNTVLSATGIIDNAADFERSNSEFLSITDGTQTNLDFSGDFSISMWIALEQLGSTAGGDVRFISKSDGNTDRAYSIHTNNNVSNGLEVELSGNGATGIRRIANSATNYFGAGDVGVLRHIVITYDESANTFVFYKDNSSSAPATRNDAGTWASIFNSSAPFRLGAVGNGAGGTSGYYDGTMDVVAVWSKVLSGSEVSDLYNSGAGIPCVGPAATSFFGDLIIFD